MSRRYTTLEDVIDQEIRPALGDDAGDYDLEAIARRCYDYRVDLDPATGAERLDTAGFEQTVDDEGFWAVVQELDGTGPADPTGYLDAIEAAVEAQQVATRDLREACRAADEADVPISAIAAAAGTTRQTIYRWLEA